ncbi:MAG TPA: tetratricopeptide repeat protein, partial [Candidatus Kapabacteria bacterium]|nr:tetratricopeptide repeat protein [Candidatus Kapabacteria bacterium]
MKKYIFLFIVFSFYFSRAQLSEDVLLMFNKSVQEYHNRNYPAALKLIDSVLTQAQNEHTYNLKGAILIAMDSAYSAEWYFRKAIEYDSNLTEYRENLVQSLMKQKKFDEAIDEISNIIKIDPEKSSTYYSRGVLHSEKKDYQKAIADFSAAINLSPKNPNYYQARAELYYLIAEYQRALSDINQSIKLNPDQTTNYRLRAFILSQLNNYKDALIDFNKYLQTNPNDKDALLGRAIALYETGKKIDA